MFFPKLTLPTGDKVLINPNLVLSVVPVSSVKNHENNTQTILISAFRELQVTETVDEVDKIFNVWRLRRNMSSVHVGSLGDENAD